MTATLAANVASVQANTWTNFALTYAHGQLILYVNGRAAASKSWRSRATGVVGHEPRRGPDDRRQRTRRAGVRDLGSSDQPRGPGSGKAPRNRAHRRLKVTTATTGDRVRQTLLGGLHTLTTPATERMAHGVIKVIRTGKLINATPIKAGGPDPAHPSMGISGAYSYDWQVVDRTMRYLQRLGVAPYLSVSSTPQILGGTAPPLSGPALRADRTFQSAFNPQVPNNLQAWQTIVRDLAYHILNQDHIPVAYWSVWNEPNGGGHFWAGTMAQYLSLYQATVNGVRSVDPRRGRRRRRDQRLRCHVGECADGFLRKPAPSAELRLLALLLGESRGHPRSARHRLGPRCALPHRAAVHERRRVGLADGQRGVRSAFKNVNYFLNDWSAAFAGAS